MHERSSRSPRNTRIAGVAPQAAAHLLLGAILAIALSAGPARAQDDIVLDFEGLGQVVEGEAVADYYDGGFGGSGSGPGPDFGITFSPNAGAFPNANVSSPPSPPTVMGFLTDDGAVMNVPAGFTDQFSFFYAAPFSAGTVTVYSGVDETGNVLAVLNMPVTPGPSGGPYPLVPLSVPFPGIARSVDFGGPTGNIAFDNITLGGPPVADCPGPENPFGVDGLILFSGPENNAWEGCSDMVRQLPFGLTTGLPIFVTRGNQQSDPNPIPGVRGPEVPCQMPLNLETPDPNDRVQSQGDEICGLDVIVEIDTGPGVITDFVAVDPVRTQVFASPPFPNARSVRLVGIYTGVPLATPFFHKLGHLDVNVVNESANPDNGKTRVVVKAGVGSTPIGNQANAYQDLYADLGTAAMMADLEPEGTIQTVLFIPEPGAWLQLPAALLGLGVLARLRRRRDG